jgi:hypothetical protein
MKIERILFATATIMLAASATASTPAAEISCVKLYDEKGWAVLVPLPALLRKCDATSTPARTSSASSCRCQRSCASVMRPPPPARTSPRLAALHDPRPYLAEAPRLERRMGPP